MAEVCQVKESSIETVKTKLIRNGKITPKRQNSRKVIESITKKSKAEYGCQEGYMRRTFIIKKDVLRKLNSIAYYDRKGKNELFEEILENYLKVRSDILKEAEALFLKKKGG